MDITEQIKKKLEKISKLQDDLGLQSVVTHIEIAEKYLTRGLQENDENIFSDVIYRTNHAFEGILKEAYQILANKRADKKNIFEIEQYLLDNNIFNERVLDLFKNYRQEWRNPATHDYKLIFSEDEAFLAIINVSAFVNILLNQILEKLSYNFEKKNIKKYINELKSSITNYNKLSLFDKVNSILSLFTNSIKINVFDLNKKEIELIGMLTAFISSLDKNIEIIREPLLEDKEKNLRLRPDLILKYENDALIVEVKKITHKKHDLAVENQLLTYLKSSGIRQGIIYYLPSDPTQQVATTRGKKVFEGIEYTIGINIASSIDYNFGE